MMKIENISFEESSLVDKMKMNIQKFSYEDFVLSNQQKNLWVYDNPDPFDGQALLNSMVGVSRDFFELPPQVGLIVSNTKSLGSCNLETNKIVISPGYHSTVSDIVMTFSHELIHASQIYKRELSITEERFINWKGVIYRENIFALPTAEYCKLPWEVEAYEKQGALAEHCLYKITGEKELKPSLNYTLSSYYFIWLKNNKSKPLSKKKQEDFKVEFFSPAYNI